MHSSGRLVVRRQPLPPAKARVAIPVVILVVALDQITKAIAESRLQPEHAPFPVLGDFIRLTLTHNTGAAMSLSLGPWSRVVFSVVAVMALILLFRFYREVADDARWRAAAIALIAGCTRAAESWISSTSGSRPGGSGRSTSPIWASPAGPYCWPCCCGGTTPGRARQRYHKEETMGLFDDLAAQAKAAIGGAAGEHGDAITHMMQSLNSGQGGGIAGILKSFEGNGLGHIVQSWIGTGQNLPVSAAQIQQALGSTHVRDLAAKLGIDPDQAAAKLSAILPGLVDHLTPAGKLPGT
jgi:uncharacterized protein YidB (DUF937 family)